MIRIARLRPIADGIDQLNEGVGRSLAWLVPVMAALQCGLVIAEFFFNASSVRIKDAVGYIYALIFLAGAGYTLKQDSHVRVDILYRGWSRRTQAVVDLAGTLCLLLPLFVTILVLSWPDVMRSWAELEGWRQSADGLPLVFVLRTFIPLGAILLILQGLALAIRCLETLTTGEPATGDNG